MAEPKHWIEISRWFKDALPLYPDCRFADYTDRVQLNAHVFESGFSGFKRMVRMDNPEYLSTS